MPIPFLPFQSNGDCQSGDCKYNSCIFQKAQHSQHQGKGERINAVRLGLTLCQHEAIAHHDSQKWVHKQGHSEHSGIPKMGGQGQRHQQKQQPRRCKELPLSPFPLGKGGNEKGQRHAGIPHIQRPFGKGLREGRKKEAQQRKSRWVGLHNEKNRAAPAKLEISGGVDCLGYRPPEPQLIMQRHHIAGEESPENGADAKVHHHSRGENPGHIWLASPHFAPPGQKEQHTASAQQPSPQVCGAAQIEGIEPRNCSTEAHREHLLNTSLEKGCPSGCHQQEEQHCNSRCQHKRFLTFPAAFCTGRYPASPSCFPAFHASPGSAGHWPCAG